MNQTLRQTASMAKSHGQILPASAKGVPPVVGCWTLTVVSDPDEGGAADSTVCQDSESMCCTCTVRLVEPSAWWQQPIWLDPEETGAAAHTGKAVATLVMKAAGVMRSKARGVLQDLVATHILPATEPLSRQRVHSRKHPAHLGPTAQATAAGT